MLSLCKCLDLQIVTVTADHPFEIELIYNSIVLDVKPAVLSS